MLSFGADDAHDYMAGVPAAGGRPASAAASGSPEYRRRVDGVTRELNAAGIRTVWLGLPIPDGPGFKHSFPIVNPILAGVAARAREPLARTSTPGTCSTARTARTRRTCACTGQLTLMRLPDGVHYTPAAGDLIAQRVLARLRSSTACAERERRRCVDRRVVARLERLDDRVERRVRVRPSVPSSQVSQRSQRVPLSRSPLAFASGLALDRRPSDRPAPAAAACTV